MRWVWILLLALAGCGPRIEIDRWGLTCVTPLLCLEEPARATEAQALYDEALTVVTREIGPLRQAPVALFCSTTACFSQFAHPKAIGWNFGNHVSAFGPGGWEAYVLRHEMIHQWQNETFGRAAWVHPLWYREGMAYTLSRDPRRTLPRADVQLARAQFQAWVAAGGDWRLGPYKGLR